MAKTGLPREDIGICFISPCPSKVTYAKSPLGTEKSQIDRVLAIKDVYPILLSCMKAVGPEPAEIGTAGKIGVNWGRSGGEAAAGTRGSGGRRPPASPLLPRLGARGSASCWRSSLHRLLLIVP